MIFYGLYVGKYESHSHSAMSCSLQTIRGPSFFGKNIDS